MLAELCITGRFKFYSRLLNHWPPNTGCCFCRDEGRINVRTRWKEYGPSVEEDEMYLAVKKNTSGSRPKELFDDLIVVRELDLTHLRGTSLSFGG